MTLRSTCLAAMLLMLSIPAIAQETAAVPAAGQEKPAVAADVQKKETPLFRVGYADLGKVAAESEIGKAAKTRFDAKAGKLKSRIDSKQKQLEKQKADLQAKLPTYSPEQRSAKVKAFEKKVDELRKMLEEADKEMKPLQEELLKDVYGKIEKVAAEYGAANGFSMIIDKKELLYIGKDVDLQDVTDALIKNLDGK